MYDIVYVVGHWKEDKKDQFVDKGVIMNMYD